MRVAVRAGVNNQTTRSEQGTYGFQLEKSRLFGGSNYLEANLVRAMIVARS